LEIKKPTAKTEIYSFRHKYADEDRIIRNTSGFVVKLAQTIYLLGSSRKSEQKTAVGLKLIAVPANEMHQRYDHAFIWGLFLSNDSALNPIIGRLLLVRVKGELDETAPTNYDRIDEADLFDDIKKCAADGTIVKPTDRRWLVDSLRNYDVRWEGRINTSILAYKRAVET
jgi:hypothetical protein